MEYRNKNQGKASKLTEKDKVLFVGLLFLLIILITLFFHFDKSKLAEVDEAEVKFGPSSSEVKKELALRNKKILGKNTLSYSKGKMISLKKQLISKGHLKCADLIHNAIISYDKSDMREALAGVGSATEELLKFNIMFLFPESRNLVHNHIKIAARKKIITKSEKVYLIKIKEMSDINCLPSLLGNNEQIERELNMGLKIIENLI